MDRSLWPRHYLGRVVSLVAVCTVLLTATFVGIVAFLEGETAGVGARLPYYVVLMAMAFVGTIVLLEENVTEGRVIIFNATMMAIVTLVAVGLSVEGVWYAFRHPEEVFVSRLVVYFLAAGLIGTGLGYWGLRHWREFTGRSRPGL